MSLHPYVAGFRHQHPPQSRKIRKNPMRLKHKLSEKSRKKLDHNELKLTVSFNELTLNVKWDEPLIHQSCVGIIDPATQKLPIVHGSGCECEGTGEYRRVVIGQVFRAELWVRQVVSVHPLDLWGHAGTVVWSGAHQLQLIVTDDILGDVNVGLIWWIEQKNRVLLTIIFYLDPPAQ